MTNPIIPFKNWSNAGVQRKINRPHKGQYQAIVVHHSAIRLKDEELSTPALAFQRVEYGSLIRRNKRGNQIFGAIPYSYLLHANTGTIGEGRGTRHGDGGTRITKRHHDRKGKLIKQGATLSVCVPGNYHPPAGTTDTLTDTEKNNITKGLLQIISNNAHRLHPAWVLIVHRDVSATACCGDLLISHINNIKKELEASSIKAQATTDVSKSNGSLTSYEQAKLAGWLPKGASQNKPATIYDVAYILIRALKGLKKQ